MSISFEKKVDAFINNTEVDVENYAKSNNKTNLLDRSFNSETVANINTKVVIVGTYTPKSGRTNGYYYTSSRRNYMYKIIDNYFELNGELIDKKEYLINHPGDKNTIDDIKTIFIRLNIAFIDVIDYAVSPDDDASDDAIEFFSLDRNIFNKVNKDAVFICNSKKSKHAFEKMFPSKICEYAAQKRQCMSYNWHYSNWELVLDKYYDRNLKSWKI